MCLGGTLEITRNGRLLYTRYNWDLKRIFFIPFVAVVMVASYQKGDCRLNQGNINWHIFIIEIQVIKAREKVELFSCLKQNQDNWGWEKIIPKASSEELSMEKSCWKTILISWSFFLPNGWKISVVGKLSPPTRSQNMAVFKTAKRKTCAPPPPLTAVTR